MKLNLLKKEEIKANLLINKYQMYRFCLGIFYIRIDIKIKYYYIKYYFYNYII